jgi:uncharacterized protein
MDQADLPASSILEAQGEALRALCLRCRVRRLDLFGSALSQRFDIARSDLDMLVTFEELEPGPYADAYFALKQGLEDLFRREVDLVTAPTLENPYFRREVETHSKTLFPTA